MASKYSIEAVFRAIDKFSSPMKSMTRSTNKFSNTIKRDFAKAQRSVRRFGENFKRYAGRTLLIGLTAATALATKLGIESTKAWDRQANAVKNVEAGIKSTNGIAKRTLEQLESQAASLQKNTFFGDESILQGVTAQMLTFTNVTGNTFDRAQAAILDVTAKLNGLNATEESLRSMSIAVGKALNDPVANLGALGRMGIQFSKSQRDTIKSLVATGKLSQAQSLILTEIEKQYGGTAAALAKTAGGMQMQTKNMTGDMLELVGKGIEPLRLKFLQFLNEALAKLLPYIKKFTEYIEQNADAIFNTFVSIMKTVWNVLKTGIPIIINIINVLKFLSPLIFGIIAALYAYKVAMFIVAIATEVFNKTLSTSPIGWIMLAIGALVLIITLLVQNWKKITDFLSGVWNTIVRAVIAGWNWLVKAVSAAWEWVGKVGQKFTFILGPIGFVISALSEIGKQWDKIVEAFKGGDILGGILKIGGALISGLLAPIQGLLELLSNIPGLGDLAKAGAEKIAGLRAGLTGETPEESTAPITPAERSTGGGGLKAAAELVIKDQTGRGELKKPHKKQWFEIKMQTSGGY